MTTLQDSIQNEYSGITDDTAGFIYCINNDTPEAGPQIHRVIYTKDLSRTVGCLKRVGDQRAKAICFDQGSNWNDWVYNRKTTQPYQSVSIKAFATEKDLRTGFAGNTLWDLREHIIENQVWCPKQAIEELETEEESRAAAHSSEVADLRTEVLALGTIVRHLSDQIAALTKPPRPDTDCPRCSYGQNCRYHGTRFNHDIVS